MKKLIYVFLAVVLFAACSNDEIKTDVKQTTLEDMEIAEANADNLYIVVVDDNDSTTVFNPVTFEKEYQVVNESGNVKTAVLLMVVFFILGIGIGTIAEI